MNKETIDVGDAIEGAGRIKVERKVFRRHHLLGKAQWDELDDLLIAARNGWSYPFKNCNYTVVNPADGLRKIVDLHAKGNKGRPKADEMKVFKSALWIIRHIDATWDDLPKGFPKKTTCWKYLSVWMNTELLAKTKRGLWQGLSLTPFPYSLWDLLCVVYIDMLNANKWERWKSIYEKCGYIYDFPAWRKNAERCKENGLIVESPYAKRGMFDVDAMKAAFWFQIWSVFDEKEEAYKNGKVSPQKRRRQIEFHFNRIRRRIMK